MVQAVPEYTAGSKPLAKLMGYHHECWHFHDNLPCWLHQHLDQQVTSEAVDRSWKCWQHCYGVLTCKYVFLSIPVH
jgi:hypothetical protein